MKLGMIVDDDDGDDATSDGDGKCRFICRIGTKSLMLCVDELMQCVA